MQALRWSRSLKVPDALCVLGLVQKRIQRQAGIECEVKESLLVKQWDIEWATPQRTASPQWDLLLLLGLI